MKTELTTEQSLRLIGLGVPKEKATDKKDVIERKEDGFPTIIGYAPIFRFTDLLEILPKAINVPFKGRRELLIHYANINGNDCPLVCYTVPYDAMGGIVSPCHKEYKELIDALYELTIWCIENGHLKFD